MARKRRDPKPPDPPRPTVEDVDAWLRQIDDVLEGLPMEGPTTGGQPCQPS